MSDQKPKRYRHTRFTWHSDDLFPECTKKVLQCQFGFKGHLTSHLNQNVYRHDKDQMQLQVIKYIAHSHFTHETDLCRHTLCEIGRTWINADLCRKVFVLHKKSLPGWIKKDLYGE